MIAAEDNRLRLPDDLHTPVLDQHRLRMGEDVRILLKLARSPNTDAARLAVRALGRYESREFITDLIQLLASDTLRDDVARALVQAFRGPVHPADRDGQQVRGVLDLLVNRASRDEQFVVTAANAIAQLPYQRADHADSAQAALREMLRRAEANARLSIAGVTRAIERFTVRHGKLSPPGEDLLERLREIAVAADARRVMARESSVAALVAAGAVDLDTLRAAAIDSRSAEVRRFAAIVLGGSSLAVDQPERIHFLKKLLRDQELPVRIEAVRAWARRATSTEGCDRLFELLKDPSPHVMLTVMDAMAGACPGDANLTDRLTAEAKAPPSDGRWHRAAHALLALARRAPDRARIPLNAVFISHPTWQVRMYAARAAAVLDDAAALERLAMDANDNVREAALPALRRLAGAESDHILVAALKRDDYQLLLAAAKALQGASSTPELAGALMSALGRVTAERKETSRDTRLALIERLSELGSADQAEQLAPLLRDYDVTVALAALDLYQRWQGPSMHLFAPVPLVRPPLPTHQELAEEADAVVEMENGRKFGMRLLVHEAPLAVTRFTRLARAGYYDGLTFHRVVPTFVIQGGSPGANEYAGDAQFMRDEIGLSNRAFTAGLSTRGRDTGDAQFYINLVDNRRLDLEYTVFAEVCELTSPGGTAAGSGRQAVESILEGDRISRISVEKYEPCARGTTGAREEGRTGAGK